MPLNALLSLGEKIREQSRNDTALRRCDACDAQGTSLLTCAQCKTRWYCSKVGDPPKETVLS